MEMLPNDSALLRLLLGPQIPPVPDAGEGIRGSARSRWGSVASAPRGDHLLFSSSFSQSPRYSPISLILRGLFHTRETVS